MAKEKEKDDIKKTRSKTSILSLEDALVVTELTEEELLKRIRNDPNSGIAVIKVGDSWAFEIELPDDREITIEECTRIYGYRKEELLKLISDGTIAATYDSNGEPKISENSWFDFYVKNRPQK